MSSSFLFILRSARVLGTLILTLAATATAQNKPSLLNTRVLTNGWVHFEIESPDSENVYVIERSESFQGWNDIALLLGPPEITPSLSFIDAGAVSQRQFYRARTFPTAATNDWKNQVFYPGDSFLSLPLSYEAPEVRWIKFAIKTNEPTRIFYQDSSKYQFHYDFAKARLPEFAGMTPAAFDAASLHTNGQQVVLGTLLFAPHAETREVGIQFVGMDLYPAAQVADWIDLVRSTIVANAPVETFYVPTFEQQGAEQEQAYFAERGIELSSITRWGTGQDVYAYGWAVGTLKYVHGWAIEQAYATGELLPEDILLTDAVPAEVPFLAGILTLNPSTPNSHVAILARSYGVPFGWLSSEAMRQRAQSLVGKPVALSAAPAYPGSVVEIIDLSTMDPALRNQITGLKNPPAIEITPKETYGAYMSSTDDLDPSDIRYFGGKASNFGFLRREIPDDSPVAFGISFDLWDEFMEQIMPSGKTLRQEIADRLDGYTYPPNVGQLQADLQEIRDLIEDDTQFTTAQQDAIAAVLLGNFDPQRKIRFRSSTNVEDSESFTGAGLYDSYSGCLADDVDSDTQGPSICEPEESNERGVFRAIRKVYASFYNDNAFLERLRHGVNESDVGMAILVHYSSPDPTEMANGVATVSFTKQSEGHYITADMVTQKGAVSVTNPDNSALPEVVRVNKYSGASAETRQWSTLMPFGANVLEWDAEYLAFVELFSKVALGFEAYYLGKTNYTLDFEYKKIVPGELHVKQVREIPAADQDQSHPRYLASEQPDEWCLFQGEYGDVFGNHRLKSRLMLTSRNLQLSSDQLETSIFSGMTIHYQEGGQMEMLSGAPPAFPSAEHGQESPFEGAISVWDAWSSPGGTRWTLAATAPTEGPATANPVVTLADLEVTLAAEYEEPHPGYNNFMEFALVTNDFGRLVPCLVTNANSIPVTRTVDAGGGTNITISFFWPAPPTGFSAGYTAPLAGWDETVIVGLTSEPIVLRGYYSQTYRPAHHNFAEEFLFEPRLEEGIDPAILGELEAQDIRFIHVYWDGGTRDRISVMGADNTLRPIGGKLRSF